jgi:hypothetical protein
MTMRGWFAAVMVMLMLFIGTHLLRCSGAGPAKTVVRGYQWKKVIGRPR